MILYSKQGGSKRTIEQIIQKDASSETTSQFSTFVEYKNPHSFFRFSFCATFFPNECPGLYQHRPGHLLGRK